ncbi:DUF1772 domain-containing protein [Aspergillus lucknowensis]|uniref:DUF1772-domain-containing protein n=1 Tax=Aspergillus lucknowensis TaxID=176173 RepID=A0ABR4L5V7_9EURO
MPLTPSLSTLKATAIISGSFLSGAMTALSGITVPVLLDTTTHPTQLLHQWVRMYHYGHIALPTLSIATAVLYFSIAAQQTSSSKTVKASTRTGTSAWGWGRRRALWAGGLTMAMVPFTWVVMNPTNGVLFRMQRGAEMGEMGPTLEEVRGLVVRWAWMHLARSVFPLVGGLLGLRIDV